MMAEINIIWIWGLTNMSEFKTHLSRNEASDFLKGHGFPVAPATLAKLAVVGGGPIYEKFGARPLYRPDDLQAWVMSRSLRKASTSDPGTPIMSPPVTPEQP